MAGRIWRALTSSVAATRVAHEDVRLRGRTYGIPFEDVWTAAHDLAAGGMRGWRVVTVDDEDGVIEAEATTPLRRRIDDVVIRIRLDEDAQTRVDARSAARQGRFDGGRNARRLGRFFRALDRAVVQARRRRLETRAEEGTGSGDGAVAPRSADASLGASRGGG